MIFKAYFFSHLNSLFSPFTLFSSHFSIENVKWLITFLVFMKGGSQQTFCKFEKAYRGLKEMQQNTRRVACVSVS